METVSSASQERNGQTEKYSAVKDALRPVVVSERLDCVRANDQCLKDQECSARFRTLRQCVAGKETNFSRISGPEARGECRSAGEALKQKPLYNCRCKRGMKKEKNCLRIYWSVYQSLQGNELMEDSPYEPVNNRLSDIFKMDTSLTDPFLTKGSDCLDAAKACNLDDTCKKYRSAYITPCTSSITTNEVCNRRKCHKALRQFFDKVPAKHSYGMLFCSCKDKACSERRRQTIVPACSYEEREMHNCLNLQETCKTNYICRSRLAHFLADCQPDPRSASGCRKENYAECLLAYSGLIGTGITPNYIESPGLSVAPWCDCANSGNYIDDCLKFLHFFKDNLCLRNAIQAFGNGTDFLHRTDLSLSTLPPMKTRETNHIDTLQIPTHNSLPGCANLIQAQRMRSNETIDTQLCLAEQSLSKDNIVGRSSSDPMSANSSAVMPSSLQGTHFLLLLTHWLFLMGGTMTL